MTNVQTHQPPLTRFQRMQLEQPWCVFCGGTFRGTSVDHVPPRGAFNFKHRPKGLEFMIFNAIGNNAPGVLGEMQVQDVLSSDHPVRKAFPDAKATFTFGPIAASYIAAFGARIALALHFEKTNEILPETGGVCVFSRSNNTLVEDGVPEEFIAMLGPPEALEQGKKFSSADQFRYASRQEGDGARTAHFITFRLSFALQAFVVRDFSEIAHFVAHVPHNLFRPGFLKGWKSPFV